ncbi:mechanosensitive ion channel [Aliifodinibius halophilus]|uniref:Mechanosensitive ion channel n=2 Tax=Fodinibius halophilus TaxID=1736908 RepID=A0A6M1TM20_9BACT|nr:mechanosensitive ion channel [Fodinibius halophilus]
MGTEFVDVYSTLTEKLIAWLETTIAMLPNMVMALLVLIFFFVAGRIVRKTVKRLLKKATDNKSIINLLETIVGILVIGIGFFIALSILDLDGAVTSLLAGAGIVGLALGFAFQDIASNFISGIILSIRHPFGIGDIIETNDIFGTVQKMNLRNTIIRTPQGQIVYIPNKKVFESPLKNYTSSGERRIDLECGVSYGDDLEKAKEVVIEAIETLDNYNDDKEIEFYYEEFGGSSINFETRFWVNFESNSDFLSARSDAIIAIMKAFEETDIMIPFPIRTLDFGVRGGEKLNAMLGNGNAPTQEDS